MTRRFGTFAVFSAAVGLTLTSGAFTATPREEQASGLRQQLPAGIKQAKLDSRLAGVARAHTAGGQAAAVAAARAAGLHVKNGRVRAVMVASSKGPAEAAARAHGGAIEGAHGKRVQVLLPPGALDAVSKNPYVEYLRPPLTHLPEAVPGEGVAASGATPWIAAGRKGAGVKVAVVDLGFAGYAERQAEGELPASLTTVDYCDGEFATEEVHGTAVAEIVHEMAPDAELTLICINTEVALGAAEEYAEANGIRVINHSVGWFNAVRGDGTGGAGTIDGVVADARAAGILWVNSAGNQSEDHWSASFNDTDGNGVHNYTSTDEGNTFLVPEGQAACVTLKWDSWPTTNQDFDLYVAHSATGALVAASTNLQNGSQTPTEEACFVNTSLDDFFFIAIDRFAATTKPRLDVVVNGGYFLQYQVAAGSINELAASPNTFAVAAICWQSNALESFSSRGPTIDGRIKPDISGHDAVSNATYGPAGGCGTAGFLGTSAAAPHVAGAAALVLGQSPGYSVTQLQGALTSAAVDMGASGKDNSFGSGRLRVPPILAPAVTSMTPGSAVAGTAVVLGGSAFTGATSVTFNGVPATTFTVSSATKITAVVSSSATMGPVQVTTPDGFGQSATPFKPTPKLTLASPSPAQAGDALTITGTNLAGASALKLGSLTLPLDSVTATEVQTTLPASGAVTNNLAATTPAGQSAGLKLGIRPSIFGFTPASAPAGTQITLDGQTFTGTSKVSFGSASASATFTVVSATQLKATVPSAAVTGPLTVTNAGGTTLSADSFSVQPKISSFTPTSGVAGTIVTISGLGLAGATAVTFDGVPATISGTPAAKEMKALVPATAATGLIEVSTPEGAAVPLATVFKPTPKLTLASPSPAQAGDALTITGTNLAGASALKLGSLTLPLDSVTATEVQTTLPASGAVTNNLAATTPAGQSAGLKLGIRPSIFGFTPASAPAGTQITLDGQTFTGTSKVSFGSASASATFTVVSATQLKATVPSAAVTGPLTVTNAGGTTLSADSFSVQPKISSFTPTSGVAGTIVTISGLGLAGATAVTFDGVPATISGTPAAKEMKALVPATAATGLIEVSTPEGAAVPLATVFKPTPKLTLASPSPAQAGDALTITGTNLAGASALKLGSLTLPLDSVTATEVQTTLPASGAVTNNLAATTPAGQSAGLKLGIRPSIFGFTPASAPAGTQITLDGQTFTGTSKVSFGSASASATFTVVSATQLKATVPSAAVTGPLTVTNAGGTTLSADSFSVQPKISSFTPTSGVAGTIVTISGLGLAGATAVTFDGVPATISGTPAAKEMKALVPATAATGLIEVSTPEGAAVPLATVFKPTPKLTLASPSPAQAGDALTITGTNLAGASALKLGSLTLPLDSVTATEVQTTLPASGAVTNNLAATTPAGQSAGLKLGIRPSIFGFTPASAPAGTQITLDGQTFTGTSKVSFGSASASATFTVVSATQLKATVPSAAVTGPLTVTNAGGTTLSADSFSVQPKISSFTPTSGVAGTIVTISGLGLAGATAVTFDGVPATISGTPAAKEMKALVPATAATGLIEVSTPEGAAVPLATVFKPTPKLTLASPSPAQAGDALTITGTNLAGASALKLGSLTLPLDSVTATEVQTTLPASGAVTNNLAATTPAGQSAGLKLGIRPSIFGFTPASAPAGTQITLDGQTFTGTSKVSFGSASASATFTVVSATQLKATVPSAAVTGPLTVTNAGGTTLSADSFGVLAKVSSFSPASGVAGTQVTMTGTGLIGATSVKFNGVEATATLSVTATSLKATVPPGATSGPITVTTPSGVGTSGSSFTIPLAITGFSPASGQVGDTVTITGAGFLGLTGVKFGDATASGTIDSDTQITVTVPPGATDGPIVVANGSVSVPSAASFDVIVVTVTSQRIVFSTDRFGGTEIAVMNGDGSGLTRLTINSSGDLAPAWSPDGTKIAFASNRDGQWDIYVMNSDGSGQTRLTDRPATTDTSPTWSRDGSMIAFESNSGTDAEIWVMGADGSNPVQLTDSPLGWNQDPAWSPDGSKIAFTSTRDSSYEIYTMNPDGSAQVNVTNSTDISEGNPDWAPDGAKVVFGNLAVVPPQSQGINTVNSGGGGGTALTFSDDRHPSWSQCSRIVFVRFVVGAEREIFVMFDDGSAVQRLTQDQWADLEVDCWEPPGP